MSLYPQSTWDRDPSGTLRKMNAEIDRECKNGYLTEGEAARIRNAGRKCFMAARNKARSQT